MIHPENQRKFSFFVAVCFTLNYIIGTGFLTLPWAIYHTGYTIGIIVLFLFALFSIFAVIYLLESMARAEYLKTHVSKSKIQSKIYNEYSNITTNEIMDYNSTSNRSLHEHDIPDNVERSTNTYATVSQSSFEITDTGSPIVSFEIVNNDSHVTLDDKAFNLAIDDKIFVGDNKYEINELSEIFLGKFGKHMYTLSIIIYLYTTLWVYATVFALAFSSHTPDLGQDLIISPYQLYILIFCFIVGPISLLELSEQIYIQVFLTMCRVLMVISMVLSILYADYLELPLFGYFKTSSSSSSFMINFQHIYILLPIAAYANIFHHSIPSLSSFVESKQSLSAIFITALVIAMISYAAIGVFISSYFGESTNISSNLNWINFHSLSTDSMYSQVIMRSISSFVVLFPALDVASAFPLNAITLSYSLMSAAFDSKDIHVQEKSIFMTKLFRLLAIIPPLIAAYFISNLGAVTNYCGLTGFIIAFIFPSLLAYASRTYFVNHNLPVDTLYSIPYISSSSCQLLTFCMGCSLFIYVTYCQIMSN